MEVSIFYVVAWCSRPGASTGNAIKICLFTSCDSSGVYCRFISIVDSHSSPFSPVVGEAEEVNRAPLGRWFKSAKRATNAVIYVSGRVKGTRGTDYAVYSAMTTISQPAWVG